MKIKHLLLIVALAFFSSSLNADIVSSGMSGIVLANIDNESEVDGFSFADSDTLSVSVMGSGSTTDSSTASTSSWAWTGTSLSGSGSIIQEKTTNTEPGGLHDAESTFELTFTIDSDMTYDFDGDYALTGATGTDDVAGWFLQGGPMGFANGGTLLDASLGTQSFADSGVLSAGTYTFTMLTELHETIGGIESRSAAFTLNSFTLVNASSVPEPGTFGFLLVGLGLMGIRRRR